MYHQSPYAVRLCQRWLKVTNLSFRCLTCSFGCRLACDLGEVQQVWCWLLRSGWICQEGAQKARMHLWCHMDMVDYRCGQPSGLCPAKFAWQLFGFLFLEQSFWPNFCTNIETFFSKQNSWVDMCRSWVWAVATQSTWFGCHILHYDYPWRWFTVSHPWYWALVALHPFGISMHKLLLAELHSSRLAGNLGVRKMRKALISRVWWLRLERTVKTFVGGCVVCQKAKDSTSR